MSLKNEWTKTYSITNLSGKDFRELVEQKLKMKAENDLNKPSHYAKQGIDTFKRMEANCTVEERLSFAKGNIDKYNWREKGQDVEDFEKIIVYAKWAIQQLDNEKEIQNVKQAIQQLKQKP